MQVFGTILSIVLIISIFTVIAVAAELDNASASRFAGKQAVWIAIAASAGWTWIRTIWRPFDGNSVDQLSVNESQGFMGLKFGNNAKSSDQGGISRETNSGNFLGLRFGGSAKHAPYEGRSVQSPEPQWTNATKEKLPSKNVSPPASEESSKRKLKRERDELIRNSSVKRNLARNIEQSNQMSRKVNELLGEIKDPTISGMVSDFVPEKIDNKKEYQTEGEFEFDKTARMFVPKGGQPAKSNEESAPSQEAILPTAKLQELKSAFDQGLIDDEEYSALKKQILGL